MPKKKPSAKKAAAAKTRARKRDWEASQVAASQDIAESYPRAPSGSDRNLRARCDRSLRTFLINCFPNAVKLEFSADHDEMIREIERAANLGTIKALAMPRGSGKTTIIARAALWAILTGRRSYVTVIGATKPAAGVILQAIKAEIMSNTILHKLYGRELHSLWSLHGESRLAAGQRFKGQKTGAEWKSNRVVWGHIPRCKTSGAAISTVGITGNIRGEQFTTMEGEIRRPDLLLGDDLQTKESAKSPPQTQERYEIVMGDALGMEGPDGKIAAMISGTVIYENDLMERLLDRDRTPICHGTRYKLVYKWPDKRAQIHWDRYRSIYEDELRRDDFKLAKSTGYIKRHYKEMHRDTEVGWIHRYDKKCEISALQHAFHLRWKDEPTFFSEYQNNPAEAAAELPFELDPATLELRYTGLAHNEAPLEAERLTAFVDVQGDVLWYMVTAFSMAGRGSIIDYGTWPDQKRSYFTKAHLPITLQQALGTEDRNSAIYGGLSKLLGGPEDEGLFDRVWQREDGSPIRLDNAGIDMGWGYSTSTIRRWCRESKHVGRVHPMKGTAIDVNQRPWSDWDHKKTDRLGVHCKLQKAPKGFRVGEFLVDTNWWKTWVAERLTNPIGSDSSISLFYSENHKMIAEHFSAETPHLKKGRAGNELIVWTQSATRDNDLFDCLVGTSVLASVLGVRIDASDSKAETRVKVQRKAKRKRRFVPI